MCVQNVMYQYNTVTYWTLQNNATSHINNIVHCWYIGGNEGLIIEYVCISWCFGWMRVGILFWRALILLENFYCSVRQVLQLGSDVRFGVPWCSDYSRVRAFTVSTKRRPNPFPSYWFLVVLSKHSKQKNTNLIHELDTRHLLSARKCWQFPPLLPVKKELLAGVHSFQVNEAFRESWKFVDGF
jgi:hypothetical protein